VELAQAGGGAEPDAFQAAGWGCAGLLWGRGRAGGWDGEEWDVVCWAESGCELNGLCRLGVKNTHRLSFSGEKRGVCGKSRRGSGEKEENSGEKYKFADEKKYIIVRILVLVLFIVLILVDLAQSQ
jgi:hypothetical protein